MRIAECSNPKRQAFISRTGLGVAKATSTERCKSRLPAPYNISAPLSKKTSARRKPGLVAKTLDKNM
jgi:hypothetical protein